MVVRSVPILLLPALALVVNVDALRQPSKPAHLWYAAFESAWQAFEAART